MKKLQQLGFVLLVFFIGQSFAQSAGARWAYPGLQQ